MRNANKKGGAAIVAVLIVIMLVAVGSAAMVATGRKAIPASDVTIPETVSSEPEDDSSSEAEEDLSSVAEPEPEPEPVVYELPTVADNYHEIDIEDLTCTSAILINADTNEIIAGMDYEKRMYPASLTKLMTLLVAAENIDDLEATYKFTDEDIDPLIEENASRAGFEAGETVTMEDLLYSSILVSGADATVGLANSVAGSEEDFVKLMNEKLNELGLSSTQFVNASGLHSKSHYSTVEDLAVITKACLENDTCREILEADTYTTSKTEQHENGIELTSIVSSRLLGYWVDCDGDGEGDADILGGKTGFTDEALYTLSTICEKDGGTYICVTAKSSGDLQSMEDDIAIYEKYLSAEYLYAEPNDTEEADDSESADESAVEEAEDVEA